MFAPWGRRKFAKSSWRDVGDGREGGGVVRRAVLLVTITGATFAVASAARPDLHSYDSAHASTSDLAGKSLAVGIFWTQPAASLGGAGSRTRPGRH
jgi:hypothetical protein